MVKYGFRSGNGNPGNIDFIMDGDLKLPIHIHGIFAQAKRQKVHREISRWSCRATI